MKSGIKVVVDYSNDRELNSWTVEVTIEGNDSMNNFDSLRDFILNSEGQVFDYIGCCDCPWEYDNAYGDNFTCSKDDMTKGEFMKEIKLKIKNWKKKNNIK